VAEVRALLQITLPLPAFSPELHLGWSYWRRGKRQQARRSHYRQRRAAALGAARGPKSRPKTNLRL
jgi:hypothetical protein